MMMLELGHAYFRPSKVLKIKLQAFKIVKSIFWVAERQAAGISQSSTAHCSFRTCVTIILGSIASPPVPLTRSVCV